ncbi:MAG: hypothetical protein HQL14_05770 [Candidatus Omnitrophica bacterium]|nr:hypothetical protein [Candidatus Omnitrophota bacterium]
MEIMIKSKVNLSAFVAVLVGLLIIGIGGFKMLDAKIGTVSIKEHNGCERFTQDLVESHAEYLKFDSQPYTTCKDGVLKRNYFDGVKVVIIGGLIILGGILVKVFFVK